MKHTKVFEVPAQTKTVVTHRTCDICHEVIDSHPMFGRNDVNVEWAYSNNLYPEGGEITTTSFDICGDCFDSKLVPWMKSLGAEPTVEETSC